MITINCSCFSYKTRDGEILESKICKWPIKTYKTPTFSDLKTLTILKNFYKLLPRLPGIPSKDQIRWSRVRRVVNGVLWKRHAQNRVSKT